MQDTNKRRHPRVDMIAPSSLAISDGAEVSGTVTNLSQGGLRLEVCQQLPLDDGSGVCVSFKIPPGYKVRANGKVVWARPGTAGWDYGIEFFSLPERSRALIQVYLEGALKGCQQDQVTGALEEKYRVVAQDSEQLKIALHGVLAPEESEALKQAVIDKLGTMSRSRLFVWLDLMDFSACAELSLDHINGWLAAMSEKDALMGIMVGPTTVGMLQFKRIARDSGIANQLINIEDPSEAQAFFQQLIASGA